MFFRLTRRLLLLVLLVIAASSAGCFVMAGRWLVSAEPLPEGRADAIFVLSGTPADRWLEAADLWREGRGSHILLSRGYRDAASRFLSERGIQLPDTADAAREVMVKHFNIPAGAIDIIQRDLDNTASEAAAVRQLAVARGWKRLIVVTSKAHTRRTLLAIRRALEGTGIRADVKGSRYDGFDERRWWRSRSDIRWVLNELPKLIAYRLGLGE